MFVFLDESGDAGFKFGKGSTDYFVVALVIFANEAAAEHTATHIKTLRQSLNMSARHEFKFNKSSPQLRSLFLESVMVGDFRIRAMVQDKRKLDLDSFEHNQDSFYNHCIVEVVQRNQNLFQNARLRVDGTGTREFKKAFQSALRQNLAGNSLHSFRFVDSAGDNLIQLADMVAGAIFRAHNPQRLESDFLKIIASRIDDLWIK